MKDTGMKHKLLCIVCPEGCEIDVKEVGGELVFPDGVCRRGEEYALREIKDPCRVLTTTVPVIGGEILMLPVRTVKAIPKGRLMEAMEQIASIRVNAPVDAGDLIYPNIAGTGIGLVACRKIMQKD